MSDKKSKENIDKFKSELSEYKQKADDYLNSWKRVAADFENYKKRKEVESADLIHFAKEVTVVKMLPTLESLEEALKHSPEDERFKEWSEGVVKIVQQLEKVLLEMGVEKIEAEGAQFDHSLHEAVEEVESNEEEGVVVEEVQKGYKLNDKVIRPAKVRVAKKKS